VVHGFLNGSVSVCGGYPQDVLDGSNDAVGIGRMLSAADVEALGLLTRSYLA